MSTTTATADPSKFNLNDPIMKTITGALIVFFFVAAVVMHTQRNAAVREAEFAIAGKLAADAELKTLTGVKAALDAQLQSASTALQSANEKAAEADQAKAAIEAQLERSREAISSLSAAKTAVEQAMQATTAALTAASEQAARALDLKNAAEAAARAVQEMATRTTAAKQVAE